MTASQTPDSQATSERTTVDLQAELDTLRAEFAELVAEHTKIQDRYQGMLFDQTRRDKDADATARRVAEDSRMNYAKHIVAGHVRDMMSPANELIYRIGQLKERAGKADVEALKKAAENLRFILKMSDPPTAFLDAKNAEVWRLREFIRVHSRKLHAALDGVEGGGVEGGAIVRCCCLGCELYRDMDREALPESGADTDGGAA